MKSKTLPYFLFLFSWLTFCSCVDRNDVRNEISMYSSCITICEETADQQMQEVTSCENGCRITWNSGRNSCLRRININAVEQFISCLNDVDANLEGCKTDCRKNVAKIKADLKKCKMACIPTVNPH